jgi:hypothetical protein
VPPPDPYSARPAPKRTLGRRDPEFLKVLESAARLQRLVPDTVLVGGAAAAIYADHRLSLDHDHVMGDLAARFEMVLDALESDDGWATNRLVYGKVILGNLDGIEAGVRQMIRKRPLESAEVTLPSGATLLVPTADETLRIKAFLVVRRNLTRDYLDVAALAQHAGIGHAAGVLSNIDEYYADQRGDGDGVATQVARQLADPRPKDSAVTRQLGSYRRLDQRWTDWNEVRRVLSEVATTIVELEDP